MWMRSSETYHLIETEAKAINDDVLGGTIGIEGTDTTKETLPFMPSNIL